ncbi:hypothetical protein [Faecalibaculum rodentium]|nr:hypothetical protein [Faecalibaculum rodentium]
MTSKEIRNEIITNRAEIRMLQRTNQGIDARNHELMQELDRRERKSK